MGALAVPSGIAALVACALALYFHAPHHFAILYTNTSSLLKSTNTCHAASARVEATRSWQRVREGVWDIADAAFASGVADDNAVPVVFRYPNTPPAQQWKAIKRWESEGFQYFVNAMRAESRTVLPRTQAFSEPEFVYYHSDRPLSGVLKRTRDRYYETLENMTLDSFVEAVISPGTVSGKEWVYLSCSVNDVAAGLQADLHPLEPLTLRNASYYLPENRNKQYAFRWTNVWIGPGGTLTPLHYDVMHNFFVQLHGAKRFRLVSPDAVDMLELYSFIHPEAQLSQRPMSDLLADPLLRPHAYEVVVGPGDVLYVPPLWFHEVVALGDVSASVSVWGHSNETKHMYDPVRAGVPISASWPQAARLLATKAFIRQTLVATLSGAGADSAPSLPAEIAPWLRFVQRLYLQRWIRIAASFSVVNATFDEGAPGFCDAELMADVESAGQTIGDVKTMVRENGLFGLMIGKHQAAFHQNPSAARRSLWLGNWVEQVALTGTADPALVARFLYDMAYCDGEDHEAWVTFKPFQTLDKLASKRGGGRALPSRRRKRLASG